MGLVDGTRELMRHDLTVWPPGTEASSHRADAARLPEAGVTRRGFLAVAGLTMGQPRGIAFTPTRGLHPSDDLSLNYIVTAVRTA